MDPTFWRDRWQTRQIGFHEGKPNTYLERFADRLTGRVLVPLCGKSEDLVFLASRGHEVVGLELVETAVQEFFAEHEARPTVTEAGPFRVYTEGAIMIFVGDFFAATRELIGNVDSIYDRASMVALPPDLRARYVSKLREIAFRAQRLLLVTVDYPQELMSGPPFSVPEAEVRAAYNNAPVELIDQGVDPRGRLEGRLFERCYDVELTGPRPTP